jgi:hypothetical protein
VLLAGCGSLHSLLGHGPQIKGSGKVKTEARNIDSFYRIETRGAADCEVTVGKGTSLQVSADDNILPLIETKVEKGTLIVTTKGSYSTRNPVRLVICTPNLDAFSIVGSGDADIRGIHSKSFDIAVSGSGGIEASGQADRLQASISGSGDMNLSQLRAATASASISGSGDMKLYVTGGLSGQISGSGHISYSGKPKNVSKSVSGSGEIHEN